jgi:hypothetical protein
MTVFEVMPEPVIVIPTPKLPKMGVVVEFVTEESVRVDEKGKPSYRTTHARARHDLVKPGRGQG